MDRPVRSEWYTRECIKYCRQPGGNFKPTFRTGDDGRLFAKGYQLSKVRQSDIPDDYVDVIINGCRGWTSPKVTGLRYITALDGDMFLDNELLYVGYKGPLEIRLNRFGFEVIENFDFVLCGDSIISLLLSCSSYYNIENVMWIMDRRMKRLREDHPKQAKKLIGDCYDSWDYLYKDL